jgi:glycosyltransferase involved in cell wall biosynthesis
MNILYLTSKPVYPIVDGGCRAMAEMLELMDENGWHISILTISTEKHPFRKEAFPEKFSQIESVSISTRIRPFPALKALVSGRSYNISRFDSLEFRAQLEKKLLSKSFDLVLFEGLYTTPYLDTCRKFSRATLAVRTHNAEFKIWDELTHVTNGIKKWYLNKLTQSLKAYEIKALNSCDIVLALSDEDRKDLQNIGVRAPFVLIPFSLPEIETKKDYSNPEFYFIGSMNWEPNRQAVKVLKEKIFPVIHNKIPEARLNLAGSFMKEVIRNEDESVRILGFINDPFELFRQKGVFLCPIYSGSGIRIKLMEALAAGATVITTSIGARGIPNADELMIIADTDEQFIQQATQLYKDQELRRAIGERAAQVIHENFSRRTVSKILKNVFESTEA